MTPPGAARAAAFRVPSGAVEIAFAWADDRWRHVVTVAGAVLFESVEGPGTPADDPRWPASPVITEVSLVTAAGRPAILGLGLAGRSHFSVSVAPHPDLPDTLLVEVACRIQEPPAWLGSTYRVADGGLVQVAPQSAGTALPRTVQWSYAAGLAGLVPVPPAAGTRRP